MEWRAILEGVRFVVIMSFLCLAACGPSAAPDRQAQSDPASDPSYASAVSELAALDREAIADFHADKQDEAAALIEKGEKLASRLLAVPRPTLAATEAASDLDELYGQMLFSNRNYGWARILYQKNLARWKHWQPQTEDTRKRLRQAETAIAECDRKLGQ